MLQVFTPGVSYVALVSVKDYASVIALFPALENVQLYAINDPKVGNTEMILMLVNDVRKVIGDAKMRECECIYVTMCIEKTKVTPISSFVELVNIETVHEWVPNFIGKAMRYGIQKDRNNEYYRADDIKEVLGEARAKQVLNLCFIQKVEIKLVYSY